MSSEISLLKPLGYQRKNSCGYCKNQTGSSSYYMSCENLRIDHYQELMDRGWRRSGKLYYKPDLKRSCCPHYTIRLKAAEFKARKEQRQALNRLNNYVLGPEYRRKAAMLCPLSRDEKRQKRDKFILLDAVHKAEYSLVKRPVGRKSGQSIEPAHQFKVTIEADSSTKEKYDIFLRYQIEVHKDPVSRWPESAFRRFLCHGLDRKMLKTSGKTQKLGTYHQCYRLDGKLIAVGVLDLLPHAVSSVYLFYDPKYQDWDLGKISAMYEIALAVEGSYQYYYMGYYIHSCRKMRYKGTFSPSYLLDPETLDWNLLDDDYRRKLDQRQYVCPSRDRKYGVPVANGDSGTGISTQAAIAETEISNTTRERSKKFADDQSLEFDEDSSEEEDAEIPDGSLFDYDIPGVLSREEVEKLDLAHWRLLVRKALIDLEDLRDWEEWDISDPNSVKGIAAELSATIGPEVMKNSALVLF